VKIPLFRTKNEDRDFERQLTEFARKVNTILSYSIVGTGDPESVITAPVGSVFHRTDGGASTSFYVKESGTGNTGWIAK
jgi:hypothetical protein